MEQKIKARVVEKVLNKYVLVLETQEYIEAIVSGNVKKNNKIMVGDFVEVKRQYDTYVITDISNRKNSLIRPPVSNIDQLVIVISLADPKPDYILLDKQITLCKSLNIAPILCINKIDLSKDNEELKKELKYIATVYTNLVDNVIYVSTVDKIGINELKVALKGKTSAFSGNSGVGKSSIIKLILGENISHKGELYKQNGLKISYVSQETSNLSGKLSDYIHDNGLDETIFKTTLRKMDFEREQFDKKLEEYSDGQKKKILLAKSVCTPANIYIWDEPLNYIDIFSRMQIEQLIKDYNLTMIFVEHDESFSKTIATKEINL